MKIILGFIIAITMLLTACSPVVEDDTSTITVVATFYPYYEAAKAVLGDVGEVSSLVPTNIEPHSFEPTPRDIQRLSQADLFITTGLEFEEFENRIVGTLPDTVHIINGSQGISILSFSDEHSDDEHSDDEHSDDEHSDDEHSDDAHSHNHGNTDPHVWLSPNNMIQIVQNIATQLSEKNNTFSSIFQANANAYIGELDVLHQEFESGLSQCEKNVIIVGHNAYSYLAEDYGFEVESISGISPEFEPTPRQIERLIHMAREYNISVVFFEEFANPRVSQVIATEVGAQTLPLYPLEGEVEGEDYLSLMKINLENLRVALECS